MAAFVTACLYCVYRWEERKKCWLKKGGEIIKITLLLIRFFSFFLGGGKGGYVKTIGPFQLS